MLRTAPLSTTSSCGSTSLRSMPDPISSRWAMMLQAQVHDLSYWFNILEAFINTRAVFPNTSKYSFIKNCVLCLLFDSTIHVRCLWATRLTRVAGRSAHRRAASLPRTGAWCSSKPGLSRVLMMLLFRCKYEIDRNKPESGRSVSIYAAYQSYHSSPYPCDVAMCRSKEISQRLSFQCQDQEGRAAGIRRSSTKGTTTESMRQPFMELFGSLLAGECFTIYIISF